MKSAQIKNDIIILEEKLKNLMESGDMTITEFCEKTNSRYPWTHSWKSGKRKISIEKILDMASKLEE